jgi:hypothetical protein
MEESMAPVKLVLNTRKEPLWVCHEDWDLSFSVDDPGPKEVDIDKLPPMLAERFNNAIAFGILIKLNGDEQKPFFPFSPPTSEAKEEAERERAEEVLSGKLKAVKVKIRELSPTLSNLRLLRALLEAERSGKARKTIINTIKETRDIIGREVAMKNPTAAYDCMIEDEDEVPVKCETQDIIVIEEAK